MKKFVTIIAFSVTVGATAQNVGIGTNVPGMKLHISSPSDTALLLIDNNTALANNTNAGIYFKNGTWYTGAIKAIGTGTNVARLGFFTFAATNQNGLTERISITDNGFVGINNTAPAATLDVNGTFRFSGGAPGAGKVLTSDASGNASWTTIASGSLPPGVSGNTFRHNGTGWVAVSNLTNDGTNVGIGTTSPGNLLTIQSNSIGLSQQSADGTTKIGFYTSSGAPVLQTHTNHDLGFATNNGSVQMLLKTNGNFGIGTTTPGYLLDVNGRMRLRHSGVFSSGIWLNKSNNTEVLFAGMVNDSTFGLYGPGTGGPWKFGFDINNAQVGIGITDPSAPLSFSNSLGNKISLWGTSPLAQYGLGIQGGLLQIYTDGSSSDFAFGYYGGINTFTDLMHIEGHGNVGIGITDPGFKLDVNGRMRVRHNGAESSGIWFNKPDNSQGTFIGQYDVNNFGIWGPGAVGSWKFLFDGNDGTLRIGTTQKAAGYLVNIGGKVIAEEVRVQVSGAWPDYVFSSAHKKLSIPELEAYISKNKHLPNIPSAEEINKDGQHLGLLQVKMMEKIEELALYIIEQNKRIQQLESAINKNQ